MRPERVPGDGAKAAKDFLSDVLPPLFTPTPTVGLALRDDWALSESPAHLAVFDDGGPSEWPITQRTTLRVTVWDSDRSRAREVAGRAAGILYARDVPGLAWVGAPSSILEDVDPDNGAILASFTIPTQVRTLAV